MASLAIRNENHDLVYVGLLTIELCLTKQKRINDNYVEKY